MKVSIITRHAIPNYGSVLQSFASQKAFEKLGYDAEIINYIRYDERGKESVLTNCHIGKNGLKNKIKRNIYFCLQYPNSQKMLKTFDKFQKQYLKLSDRLYGSMEELSEHLPDADVYVTGSDQVWGKIGTSEYDPAYFLKFVPENKHQIAFSASFGKTDLDSQLVQELESLLENYKSILVREKSAVELISQHTHKTAELILDPTLLLKRNDWAQLCENTGIENTDYIFVYQLHHNKQMEKYITQLQIKTGLPVYRVHPSIFYALKPGNFIHLPTPGQFLSYIKNAKYMVTDSFHGTVFSLIFNTPFIDIVPETTGTRIYSLLEQLGLKQRILKDFKDFSWMEDIIDFDEVNSILEVKRQETLQLLENSMPYAGNIQEKMGFHLNCSGCGACAQLCPKGAIKLVADEEGFLIPKVDNQLCINCGICYKRCPQLNPLTANAEKQIGYAAQMKDSDELRKSASGGMFYQAAKAVLSNGGIVYGAAFQNDLTVEHIRIDQTEDLHRLQGSKYVQSHIGDTFNQAKKDLEQGLSVLFSGTPCQIAGLYAVLGKNYDNLYTIDIICHGVPSQKLLRKSIELDEHKQKSKMVGYEFRNKEKRGWDCNYKKTYANGTESYGSGKQDVYYKAFLNGETYRECCYQCKYASMNRLGDITLGDFWGIEKELPQFPTYNGVSCVLVNSEKGEKLFNFLKNELLYKEVDCNSIAKHNHNLVSPTKRSKKRDVAYSDIDKVAFNRTKLYKLHTFDFKNYVSYNMPTSLKRTLKKFLK